MAVVEALRSIPVFQPLDQGILEPIAELCGTELFDKGDNVFRKGDLGNRMFFIQRGQVDVVGTASSGTEFPLSQIGSGDFFGETGMLGDNSYGTTTVVKEDLISLVLRRQDFIALLDEYPESALELLKSVGRQLSHRVRQLNEQFLFTRSLANTLEDVETNDSDRLEHPDAMETLALDSQTFEFLRTMGEEVSLGQDEILVPEGGRQRDFYILEDGRAIVQKKLPGGESLVLAFIIAGGIFGEMSFLDHGFRSAEMRSLSPVKLRAYWGNSLDRLSQTDIERLNKVYLGIIRHMCANYNLTGEDYLEAKYKIYLTLHPED